MRAFLHSLVLAAMVAIGLACAGFVIDGAVLIGTVRTADGTPVSGVTMDWVWPEDPAFGHGSATTDDNGHYRIAAYDAFDNVHNWRHIDVTPARPGYTFTPHHLDIILSADEQTFDFVATPTAPSIAVVAVVVSWQEPARAGLPVDSAVRIVTVVQ